MNRIQYLIQSSLLLLSCMCILTSCTSSKKNSYNYNNMKGSSSQIISSVSSKISSSASSESNKSIAASVGTNPSQIKYNEAGHEITITDQTDISNVISLIKAMKKVSKENRIAEGEGIKGHLIQDDLNKPFIVSEQGAFFDGYYYEGLTQGIAIKSILNKYTYDKKYIVQEIRSAKQITLLAKDQSSSKDIKDMNTLIWSIEGSNAKYSEDADPIVADFPNYHLLLRMDNKSYCDIAILNKGNFSITSSSPEVAEEEYKSNEKILEYAKSLIPPVTEKNVDHLIYLFQSTKVNVMDGNNQGDYTYRLNAIVRTFLDGVIQGNVKTSSKEKSVISLSFVIDKKTYDVVVYQNGFTYNHKYYLKNGIGIELENLISAG